MSRLPAQHLVNLQEEVSVNEKVVLVLELLETKSKFLFTDLIVRPGSLMDVICSFLAILELVKNRQISLSQSRLFGDIRIERGKDLAA
jgi:segregation and condensation protein A